MPGNSTHICSNCGSSVRAKTFTPGSISIEIILWFTFIVPGVVYSLWRLTSRYKACPACKSKNIIPIASPHGKMLLKKYQRLNC